MHGLRSLLLNLWHRLDRWQLTQDLPSGAWGERWAARYLRLHGCRIIDQNVRPCRHGELDLIALHGKTYLFVEVKTRKNERHGSPIEAVHRQKRRLMRRCATHWLSRHFLLNDHTPYRFDAIEVVGSPHHDRPEIRWIQGLDMSQTHAPEI